MHAEISEAERFPRLTAAGRRFLHELRQDRHAPIWNWPNGEQLDDAGLQTVHEFAQRLQAEAAADLSRPEWLTEFADRCLAEVPFYRQRCPAGARWESIPSCHRGDLAQRPWDFVPDSQPLDQLIVFSSSGTTGHPAQLPTHPATAACGVPLLEAVLSEANVSFPRGVAQMALLNVTDYPDAYTTALVVAYLEEAGCVRVNLQPPCWRQPDDCTAYLQRFASPVVLGDPVSLSSLQRVPLTESPRALLSSIMSLSDGLLAELASRYGCPVFDLYALTEAGILAVRTPTGHRWLPPDVFVEILDEHNGVCPAGVRGEVTITGGRNPFAPLLRYRTGDFAALEFRDGRPWLNALEGRVPVIFRTSDDREIHGIEVSRVLRRFPFVQFQLEQSSVSVFCFRYRGLIDAGEIRDVLHELLGRPDTLQVEPLPASPTGRKITQYLSPFQPRK